MHSIFLFFTLNYQVEPLVSLDNETSYLFFLKKKGDITISDWQSQSDIETCKIKNA